MVTMSTYYNENDPYACLWLKNLMHKGLISYGDIDERSISDVLPSDLKKYKRCHFFAGIGIWDHALQLSGWENDKELWTGSCPCQPFSAAGRKSGFVDERHLWPHWFHLIRECRPKVLFGEQTGGVGGLSWYDLVHDDLEGEDYSVAAFDMCAIGGHHKRQRLWFLAHSNGGIAESKWKQPGWKHGQQQKNRFTWKEREYDWLFCRDGQRRAIEPGTLPTVNAYSGRMGRVRPYGNAIDAKTAAVFIAASMEVLP